MKNKKMLIGLVAVAVAFAAIAYIATEGGYLNSDESYGGDGSSFKPNTPGESSVTSEAAATNAAPSDGSETKTNAPATAAPAPPPDGSSFK